MNIDACKCKHKYLFVKNSGSELKHIIHGHIYIINAPVVIQVKAWLN